MTLDSFETLALHGLQDLYSAEQQAIDALPQMIEAASTPELKEAFEMHLRQTQEQLERVEQILQKMDAKPGAEQCISMQGLIAEAQKLIQQGGEPEVLDAALIAAQQKVEHLEIACYGTAVSLAETLGDQETVALLRKTLQEEKQTDEKLTALAESLVNQQAATH